METTNDLIRDTKSLSITRLINAPVKFVFEVWTKPEHIKHWWGPRGFTNSISKMDVKPEGEWVFVMHGPDGTNYDNKNIFVEVEKNKRIVIRHCGPPDFKMTATFTAQGNKTLLNLLSEFESEKQLKEVIERVKADIGFKQNVDKLEEYLGQTTADTQQTFTREFDAPKDLVFKAWTDPTHLGKWWGPKGSEINVSRFDLKPGGEFLYSLKYPNGMEMWGKFIYREVTAPDRLVFINCFSDKDGNITKNAFLPVFPRLILNVLTLDEKNGKTTLTLRGGPISATAEEYKAFEDMKESMQGGFKGTFDQLEEFLTKELVK